MIFLKNIFIITGFFFLIKEINAKLTGWKYKLLMGKSVGNKY